MPIPQRLELHQKAANVELIYFSAKIPLSGLLDLDFSHTNEAQFLTQLRNNLKSHTGMSLEPLDAKRTLVQFDSKGRKPGN